MAKIAEMYMEEESAPENQLKGFTKTFAKKTKEKRSEDANINDLLAFKRENRLVIGTKIAEKGLRTGKFDKIYVASNCEDLSLRKLQHYGAIAGVSVVQLDLDNGELAQKLQKPFLVSVVSIRRK